VPKELWRTAALQFFAFAIEIADKERGDAWCLRETRQGIRLMTGRLLACAVARKKMRVSVIGPISSEIRKALDSDVNKDEDFRLIPGGVLMTFPVEHAAQVMPLLQDGFRGFVEASMARVRNAIGLEDHVL
jgi:hypothetical protein